MSIHVCEWIAFPASRTAAVGEIRKMACGSQVAGGQCGPTNSEAKGEERPMNFDLSDKQKEWLNRVQAFMKTHVRPAVPIYDKQDAEGPRWKVIPILEEL